MNFPRRSLRWVSASAANDYISTSSSVSKILCKGLMPKEVALWQLLLPLAQN